MVLASNNLKNLQVQPHRSEISSSYCSWVSRVFPQDRCRSRFAIGLNISVRPVPQRPSLSAGSQPMMRVGLFATLTGVPIQHSVVQGNVTGGVFVWLGVWTVPEEGCGESSCRQDGQSQRVLSEPHINDLLSQERDGGGQSSFGHWSKYYIFVASPRCGVQVYSPTIHRPNMAYTHSQPFYSTQLQPEPAQSPLPDQSWDSSPPQHQPELPVWNQSPPYIEPSPHTIYQSPPRRPVPQTQACDPAQSAVCVSFNLTLIIPNT